jgi:gamma-glutamyltranspeptidase
MAYTVKFRNTAHYVVVDANGNVVSSWSTRAAAQAAADKLNEEIAS